MILSVSFDRTWRFGETWDQKFALVVDVMENLKSEGRVGNWYTPGQDAWFVLADQRCDDDKQVHGSNLRVGINRSTGYGGLIWCVTEGYPAKGEVFDSVWISNNPEPPDFDPRIVSDPGYPLFHDVRSALPLSRVRVALEEFCRTDTGDRPTSVDWVRGDLNGRRIDGSTAEDFTVDVDPFA